jgi:PAS domain S-box-containing protein
MRAYVEAVAEAPNILLAALERASDAVVVLDGELRIAHFNAAAEEIWRLDRIEVLGRHVGCLGVKEFQLAQNVPAQAGDGDALERTGSRTTIQRRDGSRVHVSLSVSYVEANGQRHTIAVIRDVTAEAELRERLALVSLIADGTNRAVLVTDHRLRIVYTNAAFSGMYGYSLEEAKGRQAYELLVGRHTDRRALVRLRFLIDEKRGGEEEFLSYDKNGEEIWI